MPSIQTFIQAIGSLLGALIPVLIAAALAAFFYGLVMYVWGAAGGNAKAEAREVMIAGLVALFVMVSVWGIIRFAQQNLGISGSQAVPVPQIGNLPR